MISVGYEELVAFFNVGLAYYFNATFNIPIAIWIDIMIYHIEHGDQWPASILGFEPFGYVFKVWYIFLRKELIFYSFDLIFVIIWEVEIRFVKISPYIS